MEQNFHLIVDVNGNLTENGGPHGRLADLPIDNHFWGRMTRLYDDKFHSKDFEEKMKIGLDVDSFPDGKEWKIFTLDDLRGIRERLRGGFVPFTIAERFRDYFKGYKLIPGAENAMRILREKNISLSLGTGIHYQDISTLVDEIGGVIEYLDPNQAAILRPSKDSSGSHTKAAGSYYLKNGNKNINPKRVAILDDDFPLVYEIICRGGADLAFMPISRKVALEQRPKFTWTPPQVEDIPNNIYFEHGLLRIAEEWRP